MSKDDDNDEVQEQPRINQASQRTSINLPIPKSADERIAQHDAKKVALKTALIHAVKNGASNRLTTVVFKAMLASLD